MRTYDAEFFDPESTIECGQLFRYEKLDENDYIVRSLDKICRLTKTNSKVKLDSDTDSYFENFFDLDRDYGMINRRLLNYPELNQAAKFGKGIRILKQDLYESIISFIISANNNIPRIKGIIDRLCKMSGEKNYDSYSFPDKERLCELSAQQYRSLGAGFRDKYLAQTSSILAKTDLLYKLPVSDDDSAFKLLCALPGVGAKVANCVMLFGLGRLHRFPVDVWMFRACKNDILNSPSKVTAFYSERYGEYAGVAQQYIFYSARKTHK